MKPVLFEEVNVLVCPPEGMEGLKIPMCKSHLESGVPVIVSSWELSDEELAEITRTKRLWVVEYGETHHAMAIVITKPLEQRPVEQLNVANGLTLPPARIKGGELTIGGSGP